MSKKIVSVKSNFMYQMLYQILLIILPFVTSPYIARVIGAAGLGDYSFSYSIAYYFLLFANLGIQNYGNRAIAQCKDDSFELSHTFSSLLAVHILFSLLSLALYFCYAIFLSSNKLLAFIQSFMVLGSLLDISWFYFGIEKFKLTSIRSMAIKVLTVIAVFIFVREPSDLWKYCAIMSLGMLLGNVFLWLPLYKFVQLSRPSLEEMRVHIKPLVILFIPSVAVSLYKYMDKIMVGYFSTNIQLGFYENAEKAVNIPTTIISSFGMVMLPRMSNLIANNEWKQIQNSIQKSMQFVMWMSIAFTFGMIGVAVDFASIFWGNDFMTSGYLMMGLAITIPFISFANVIRTQILIPSKRDKEYIISVFLGAGINLAINYFFIPLYGSYGAVLGTIVAEISVCVSQSVFVRKEIKIFSYLKECFVFTLIGILMLLVISFTRRILLVGLIDLFIVVIIAAFVYCMVSLCYFKFIGADWIFDSIYNLKKR